jgi:hypothetical protein
MVSLNQTGNKPLHPDISSCQSIAVNTNSACILPELSFSLKKVFSELTFLKIIHKSFPEKTIYNRTDLSVNELRLYRKKAIAFIPLKQKSFLLLFHYTSANEDDHNLPV